MDLLERLGVPNAVREVSQHYFSEALKEMRVFFYGSDENISSQLRTRIHSVNLHPTDLPSEFGDLDHYVYLEIKGYHTKSGKKVEPFVNGSYYGTTLYKPSFRINVTVGVDVAGPFDGILKSLTNEVRATLLHEFTHAYEDVGRRKSGSLPLSMTLDGTFDAVTTASKGMVASSEWNDFVYALYLACSYERNARVAQAYSYVKDVRPSDKLSALKASQSWLAMEFMRGYSIEPLLKRHNQSELIVLISGMMSEVDEIAARYGVTVRYADVERFKKQVLPEVKQIMSMRKDPVKFLRFWEKRITSTAEDHRRRLLRVVSI